MFQNVDRKVQEMLEKYGPGETQQSNLYVQIIDDAAHFFAVLITIFLLDFMVCQHLLNIRLDLISMSPKKNPKSSLPTGYLISTSAISCIRPLIVTPFHANPTSPAHT